MTSVDFPENLWNIGEAKWRLETSTASFGPGYNGRSTVYFTENRVWRCSVTIGKLWGGRVPAFRSFINSLKGRHTTFCVPVCNLYHEVGEGDLNEYLRRIGVSEADIAQGYEEYSDGTQFTDNTGFSLPDRDDPSAVYAASIGDTEIRLSGALAGLAGVGAFFSYDNFLYEVEENAGGSFKFHPPLRTAIGAGEEVQYKDPKICVRLSDDNQGQIRELPAMHGGPVQFSFEEVFAR